MKFPEVDCEREDCRITYQGSRNTLLGYTPVYDKHGNLLTKNPNKATHCFLCTTCMKFFETTGE